MYAILPVRDRLYVAMTQKKFVKKKVVQIIGRLTSWGLLGWGLFCSKLVWAGVPNGTWLSQNQIRFHLSNNTLSQVMQEIQLKKYRVVFLDFRGVSEEVQQRVSEKAREFRLIPVVWIQTPQYRSLTIADLIHEARYGDGIQVDDHFFAHYSRNQFKSLSSQYKKPIFCSIQPFQADLPLLTEGRCNQLDIQCYTSQQFDNCLKLADQLKAIVSLSNPETLRYKEQLGVRRFNVFLWPYSNRHW